MASVLIVANNVKAKIFLTELLHTQSFSSIVDVNSGSEARRLLLEEAFDVIVINTPLPDEFGDQLATLCTDTTTAGVMLLVKAELADDIAAKVEDFGVFLVPKPLSRHFFFQSLKFVTAAHRRFVGLQDENIKLQQKIEEIRLVDRAKCALIQYLNLTEAQAHRYIEKQAMDLRLTRRNVAQSIINTYEN